MATVARATGCEGGGGGGKGGHANAHAHRSRNIQAAPYTLELGVWESMKRACSKSLGSICFGSLIVSLVKAAHALCKAARDGARRLRPKGAAADTSILRACVANAGVSVCDAA